MSERNTRLGNQMRGQLHQEGSIGRMSAYELNNSVSVQSRRLDPNSRLSDPAMESMGSVHLKNPNESPSKDDLAANPLNDSLYDSSIGEVPEHEGDNSSIKMLKEKLVAKTSYQKKRKKTVKKAKKQIDQNAEAKKIYNPDNQLIDRSNSPQRAVKTRVQPRRSPFKAFMDESIPSQNQFQMNLQRAYEEA